jgi:hypothetical protein
MSLLTDLGAQLRATSDELPTGLVTAALDRLRSATEQLTFVRQASVDPIGVPLLGNATEHAERAAAALRIAQDAIAAYLAVLGLSATAPPPPDPGRRTRPDESSGRPGPEAGAPPPRPPGARPPAPPEPDGRWRQRVSELTGEPPPPPEEVAARHPSTAELLRTVAGDVRSGDRARLGRRLQTVDAATGRRLSTVTPPVLRRLAGDLLGHEPRPDDLPRLRTAVSARVRSLLPGAPAGALDALLARICRSRADDERSARPADNPRADERSGRPADNPRADERSGRPADGPRADDERSGRPGDGPGTDDDTDDDAVTGSVLAGVLLARLGRDPATLDPETPDPSRNGADA